MCSPNRLVSFVVAILLAALLGPRVAALELLPAPIDAPQVPGWVDPEPPVPLRTEGTTLVGIHEYHNAAVNAFFVTGSQPDVEALESGRIVGWKRTQPAEIFMALESPGYYGRGGAPKPVCRYFIPPHSHFLSASKAECDAVGTQNPDYVLETSAAFYVWLPNAATGECASVLPKAGGPLFRPVYRLWNARADTNHRFTTSLAVRAEMIARGWISEGYGPLGVAMCAPLFGG
jgi:hypothetical protein